MLSWLCFSYHFVSIMKVSNFDVFNYSITKINMFVHLCIKFIRKSFVMKYFILNKLQVASKIYLNNHSNCVINLLN